MKLKDLIKRIHKNKEPSGGWAASIKELKLSKKEKGDLIEAFSIAILTVVLKNIEEKSREITGYYWDGKEEHILYGRKTL